MALATEGGVVNWYHGLTTTRNEMCKRQNLELLERRKFQLKSTTHKAFSISFQLW